MSIEEEIYSKLLFTQQLKKIDYRGLASDLVKLQGEIIAEGIIGWSFNGHTLDNRLIGDLIEKHLYSREGKRGIIRLEIIK